MKKLTTEELKTMTMAQIPEETTTESENMKDSMDWDYVESELWKRHQMMANKEEHTMKYDNCKGCGNVNCEHYGKDREFVCINGISCKTEKAKIAKSYVIKCMHFRVNEDLKMIGDPINREFFGSTWSEAKAAWRMAMDNNDMTKFSALHVYDIIIPEED